MIVAGIGLREAASVAALRDAITATGQRPDALACLRIKATPALRALADTMALPLTLLDEAEIAGTATLTCSPRIKARFATGSVAEAVALVAARQNGHHAHLIAPRVTSADGMATAALAIRSPL